ncbi:hypothetical protein BLA60_26540 [Actinophytocola xinjiangensis]|uniref:Uncharacterized protein n=1 Tax=Actinophytocola xinjiangensis TaxID=485602 RepID=A0A7Z0WJC1_9PSEU|nr:hypothetical protein [Actinophytocola xinjiangensis]OLF07492.1 hypothetical protein BLA60_26540 [Actinophytocola xinjiangensis]
MTNYAALVPYTPYVNAWSDEHDQPATVIERPGAGIGYADETLYDRDRHGVLWQRVAVNQGAGEPNFGKVHPFRQRRAMRRLLCGVCAGPADRTDEGVLWLVRDYRDDWPDWPNRMGVDEPPVCVGCARRASRMCPELRQGAVAIRAGRYPIAGVTGLLYRTTGTRFPRLVGGHQVPYDDPAARWTQAVKILRKLGDCRVVPLDELCRT